MALKITIHKQRVSDAERFVFLRERIKRDTEEMNNLKAEIDAFIGEEFDGIDAGGVVITRKWTKRKTLDKNMVLQQVGQKVVDACTKVSEYYSLHIAGCKA